MLWRLISLLMLAAFKPKLTLKTAYRMALLALMALAGCAACSKEGLSTPEEGTGEDLWTPLTGDKPVAFATAIAGAETKATTPLPTGTNFCVFAFYQPGVVSDDPLEDKTGTWNDLSVEQWTPNFMYDQEVTYNSTLSRWTYNPVKYWPNNAENTLTFWAYCPQYDDDAVLHLRKTNSPDPYGNTIPGIPEIQFTTDGSRDLLVSDIAQDQSYRGGNPADGVVPLLFHHKMCWVDFRVRKNDPLDRYNIVLESIDLRNLRTTGVLRSGGWGSGWGSGNIDVFSGSAAMDKTTYANYRSSGQILPLPQLLKGTSATLRVVYTFGLAGSGDSPVEYVNEVPLGDLHDFWEMEKHYTYTINISAGSPILFTATVEAWGSEQNGFFTVN